MGITAKATHSEQGLFGFSFFGGSSKGTIGLSGHSDNVENSHSKQELVDNGYSAFLCMDVPKNELAMWQRSKLQHLIVREIEKIEKDLKVSKESLRFLESGIKNIKDEMRKDKETGLMVKTGDTNKSFTPKKYTLEINGKEIVFCLVRGNLATFINGKPVNNLIRAINRA